MDSATKIFETIISGGEQGLLRMIDEGQAEHQLLDFKQAARDSAPLQDSDRRNLAKTVGGFANADGGVIVWGMTCRKNEANIDVVSDPKPIAKVHQFKVALDETTPQLVQPYPDVKHELIESTTPGSGYIVTLVPYWDGLPVRSTISERGSDFFLRTGNLTQPMPHSSLAERFGRKPLPRLRVIGAIAISGDRTAKLKLAVHNSGRGLAKYITVIILPGSELPSSGLTWGIASGYEISEEFFQSQGTCYEADSSLVIYPESARRFYELHSHALAMESLIAGRTVKYRIFCDGFTYQGAIKAVQHAKDLQKYIFEEIVQVSPD